MQVAKGRLRGKQPKLSKSQEAHVVSLHEPGERAATSPRPMTRLGAWQQ